MKRKPTIIEWVMITWFAISFIVVASVASLDMDCPTDIIKAVGAVVNLAVSAYVNKRNVNIDVIEL